MNLSELMVMYKELQLLDEACTVREITTFFAQVNLDDELFVDDDDAPPEPTSPAAQGRGSGRAARPEKADGSAELAFDEFCEIVVRTCNEKVPAPREGRLEPFETTLDSWLGLFMKPRAQAAARARAASEGRKPVL